MATVNDLLKAFSDALGEQELPTDTSEIQKRYRFLNTAIAFAWERYKWMWTRAIDTSFTSAGQSSIDAPDDFASVNRIQLGNNVVEEAPANYAIYSYKPYAFPKSGDTITLDYTLEAPEYTSGDENVVIRIPRKIQHAIIRFAYANYRAAISDPFGDVRDAIADSNALLQEYEARQTDTNQRLNMVDVRSVPTNSYKYYVSGNEIDGYSINFIQIESSVSFFMS